MAKQGQLIVRSIPGSPGFEMAKCLCPPFLPGLSAVSSSFQKTWITQTGRHSAVFVRLVFGLLEGRERWHSQGRADAQLFSEGQEEL